MKRLICPRCHRSVTVTDAAQATCSHGRRISVTNKAETMIPIEQLTERTNA